MKNNDKSIARHAQALADYLLKTADDTVDAPSKDDWLEIRGKLYDFLLISDRTEETDRVEELAYGTDNGAISDSEWHDIRNGIIDMIERFNNDIASRK